jgi:flagellar biosynthetic protein FliQ
MTPESVIVIGQQALVVTAMLSAPLLLAALAAGLVIGMFQAATQINEVTLSFIPKLLVLAAALYVGSGWMIQSLTVPEWNPRRRKFAGPPRGKKHARSSGRAADACRSASF